MSLHKLGNLAIPNFGITTHDPEGRIADTHNQILKINVRYAPNFIEVEKHKEKSKLFFEGISLTENSKSWK